MLRTLELVHFDHGCVPFREERTRERVPSAQQRGDEVVPASATMSRRAEQNTHLTFPLLRVGPLSVSLRQDAGGEVK